MASTITIHWSETKGEIAVKLSGEFEQLPWVSRADCLKDALYDLEELYRRTLAEFGE